MIIRHGGWSPTSVDTAFSYNDVDPATHAATLRDMYNNTVGKTLSLPQPLLTSSFIEEGRPVMITLDNIVLRGYLLLNTLPNANLVRVRVNGTIRIVPRKDVKYSGI